MSDKSRDSLILNGVLGEDDFARKAKLPGTPHTMEDGGKSFEGSVHAQKGMNTAGVNFLVLTSHFDLATLNTTNERDAFGAVEAFVGKAGTRALGKDFSILSYAQADVTYSDTKVTPHAQNAVHSITGGRDMRPIYKASDVPNDLNIGASAVAEIRREGLQLGKLEVKPSVFAAAALGTERAEGAVGARVAIGKGVDGTARPMPTANPEAPGTMFVRDPQNFKGGNWSVGASFTQYGIADNRYLRGGEPERFDLRRMAVDAAYNISDRVGLTASYENYTNPVQRLPNLDNQGPQKNTTLKGGVTFRF